MISPSLIFPTCRDLHSVRHSFSSALGFPHLACSAVTRFYVQKQRHDRYLAGRAAEGCDRLSLNERCVIGRNSHCRWRCECCCCEWCMMLPAGTCWGALAVWGKGTAA